MVIKKSQLYSSLRAICDELQLSINYYFVGFMQTKAVVIDIERTDR
ncbi:hypothetical protein GCM10010995_14630 [Cysteiniphilum litorale]|uniref:Uncharacterized protein n=1 Tax=Cysteiniphilum litorale TaxID=2056700 RepID=A0A8J2Z4F5_9GAMM|nr:hypothetical protein GCM10010995_14630 [Cysteiniphilum litorale]